MAEIDDAKATLQCAVLDGLCDACPVTGITAGPKADRLIADVMKNLLRPEYRWAMRVLGEEAENG